MSEFASKRPFASLQSRGGGLSGVILGFRR
jgi:hypothetical protein